MVREGVTVLADRSPRRPDLVPEAALEVGFSDHRRQAVGFRFLRLVEWFVPWPGCWELLVFTPGS